MENPVISVSNISKSYRYYKSNHQRLQHLILGMNTGRTAKVLRDVSFEINRGEKVGLLGVVGSGRTTLMEILSGTIKPDGGKFRINGDLTSVMDNRLGFDNGLSGRENLHIMGTILGWPEKTISEKEQSYIEFAKLEKIIDQPVKLYPKGAAARLGFLLNTENRPDIMLFDDAFSFGGTKYDLKFISRLQKKLDENNTLLMTISNISVGRALCDRGIVLHRGRICFDGPYQEAVDYFKVNCKSRKKKKKEKTEDDLLNNLSAEKENDNVSEDNSDVGI